MFVSGPLSLVHQHGCKQSLPPPRPLSSAFSDSTPAHGGLHMKEPVSRSADFPPTKGDSSLLMKSSCSLTSDVETSFFLHEPVQLDVGNIWICG